MDLEIGGGVEGLRGGEKGEWGKWRRGWGNGSQTSVIRSTWVTWMRKMRQGEKEGEGEWMEDWVKLKRPPLTPSEACGGASMSGLGANRDMTPALVATRNPGPSAGGNATQLVIR